MKLALTDVNGTRGTSLQSHGQQETLPSTSKAHQPLVRLTTAENVPSGASPGASSGNGSPPPQHTNAPPTSTPQDCIHPAATAENRPGGGSDSPLELSPQHTTPPSSRNPHECLRPADTETNSPPSGGSNAPSKLWPQQTATPSRRNPHECHIPADTETNRPSGGSACPNELSPQHDTAPPDLTAHT